MGDIGTINIVTIKLTENLNNNEIKNCH